MKSRLTTPFTDQVLLGSRRWIQIEDYYNRNPIHIKPELADVGNKQEATTDNQIMYKLEFLIGLYIRHFPSTSLSCDILKTTNALNL